MKDLTGEKLTNIDFKDITMTPGFEFTDKVFSLFKKDLLLFTDMKTQYQIEKFQAMEEGTSPVHQYRLVLIQLKYALSESRRMYIDIERGRRRLERLRTLASVMDRDERFKRAKKLCIERVDVVDVDLTIMDVENGLYLQLLDYKTKMEELRNYVKVLSDIRQNNDPALLTPAALIRYEPLYWEQRLARQAYYDKISKSLGVSVGNINAIKNINQKRMMPNNLHQANIDLTPNDESVGEIVHLMSGNEIKKTIEEDLKLFETLRIKLKEKEKEEKVLEKKEIEKPEEVIEDGQKEILEQRDRAVPEI